MTTLRPLDLRDAAVRNAVVALQRAAYRVEAKLAGTEAIPALRETPEALAASGEAFVGAFDGDRLVGAVSFKRDGDVVDIHRLVVDPRVFRRRIASALLDDLERREADARTWLVATAAANAPALALYRGRGFGAAEEATVAGDVRIVRLRRERAG